MLATCYIVQFYYNRHNHKNCEHLQALNQQHFESIEYPSGNQYIQLLNYTIILPSYEMNIDGPSKTSNNLIIIDFTVLV